MFVSVGKSWRVPNITYVQHERGNNSKERQQESVTERAKYNSIDKRILEKGTRSEQPVH